MDKVAAFQHGYVKRCAELGVHPKHAALLCKCAAWNPMKELKDMGASGLLLLTGLGGLAGTGTGIMHEYLTRPTDEDIKIKEMKIRANALRREADAIRQRVRRESNLRGIPVEQSAPGMSERLQGAAGQATEFITGSGARLGSVLDGVRQRTSLSRV